MYAIKALLALASLATLVSGHAHMTTPLTLFAPEDQDPNLPWDMKDYQIDNSLYLNGTNWPCKGYHHSQYAKTQTTLNAGSEYDLVITVGAHHEGGTCELSLSYDNGKSFRVFKRFIGGCPVADWQWKNKYKIPDFAPSGKRVILSWTWLALTGNIEMWQSCALVDITGVPGKENEGRFRALPSVWRGALHEFSHDCVTKDTKHIIPPLHADVEEEFSRDDRDEVPSRETAPYPFEPKECDNDDIIEESFAYDEFRGFAGSDCNLEPVVPCSMTEGWPTRGSYIQACTRHADPVGWKEWPIECGGDGPAPEGSSGGGGPGHGGGHHGKGHRHGKRGIEAGSRGSGRSSDWDRELKSLLLALQKLLQSK